VLTKAGAYIRFVDKETGEVLSWQGRQAFRNALSDPDLYAKIEAACGGLQEELTQEEIDSRLRRSVAQAAAGDVLSQEELDSRMKERFLRE
jgi:hypothetical protein